MKNVILSRTKYWEVLECEKKRKKPGIGSGCCLFLEAVCYFYMREKDGIYKVLTAKNMGIKFAAEMIP